MPDPQPILLPSPAGAGRSRVVPLPTQIFLTGTENLRITSWNSQPGVQVMIQGRYFDSSGFANAFQLPHTPNTDRSSRSEQFPLNTGAIANLTVFCSAGGSRVGQTFVKVELIQGFSGFTMVLGTLVQGYISQQQTLSWPGSPISTTLDGGGYVFGFVGTLPGLGAHATQNVPTGARWELVSALTDISTSAVVANRQPFLQINAFARTTFISLTTQLYAASSIGVFSWAQHAPVSSFFNATYAEVTIPNLLPLLAGYQIDIGALNLDAGDQIDATAYVVREWLEGL